MLNRKRYKGRGSRERGGHVEEARRTWYESGAHANARPGAMKKARDPSCMLASRIPTPSGTPGRKATRAEGTPMLHNARVGSQILVFFQFFRRGLVSLLPGTPIIPII
jgi:hypothetical protein